MQQKYTHVDVFELRPKIPGAWRGWHRIVPAFFFLVGIFNARFKTDFYSNYYTTLGNVMYIPAWKYDDFCRHPTESVIRHEAVHYMDSQKYGIKYYVSYLFAKGRTHWEKRAYVQNMIIDKNINGYVSAHIKGFVKAKFLPGSIYWINMDPYKAQAMIDEMAEKVNSGEWSGNYPDVK